MLIRFLLPLTAVCGLLASSVAQAVCPFNVAGGTTADSLRDGVLLVRYARGKRGAELVAGTGATAATVEANISSNIDKLDVNGNGVFDVDDAGIISRNVFGFSSANWLPDGKAGAYGTRNTPPMLKTYVDEGCTPLVVSAPTAAQFETSRFLIQSTFGPSRSDIAAFLALPGADTAARAAQWVNTQFAMARPQTHFQYLQTRKAEYDAAGKNFYTDMTREAFWGQALASPDQLRQRLAFALTEILVVSDNGNSDDPYELAAYLDLMADNGLTNYRDILYKVALSPAMGRYLSHLKNDGGNANPNENFAREVLQLFGVGLFQLGVDGEKILAGGQPVATYDENTVKGFAKVFTGLSYDDPYCTSVPLSNCLDGYGDRHPSWNWAPDRTDLGANFPPEINGWKRPMVMFPGRHSAQTKQVLAYTDASPVGTTCTNAVAFASTTPVSPATGPLLPAIVTTGSGVTTGTKVNATQANATINQAIDNIFCHPNVGPFLSKSLIRFFVTSTPTPAYVARVAAAFNNTGGVRGDMQAVMRAILLDTEAMQPTATAPMNFGKLKEPMLRLSAILRAFNARAASGRYQITYGLDQVEYGISQGPLQSPTVFNYFHPEFSPPGPVSSMSAIGPEFEITTTTAIASTQNYFGGLVTNTDYQSANNNAFNTNLIGYYNCNMVTLTSTDPTASTRGNCLLGDLSELYSLYDNAGGIFDFLNLVLMGGSLNATNKANLVAALDSAFVSASQKTRPVLLGTLPTAAQITTYNNQVNSWQSYKRDRVRGALWLAVHLPEFQIQR